MKKTKIDSNPDKIWYPYTRFGSDEPVLIKKGEKEFLITNDGSKIIDAVSSWWTNVHGHSHPEIVKAVAKQIASLDHLLFAGFTHQPAKELAELLCDIVPGKLSRVFYSDNGSTAVEVALKIALQYWSNIGKPRKKIIAFKGSYHGDTFGAMSVSERGSFTKPFSDKLFNVLFIEPPVRGKELSSIAELKKLLEKEGNDIAAFIYEPLVMGTAGMKMYKPAELKKLIRAVRKHQVICIADEVMTGFGRTGKLFASGHITEKPDLVCLSKGITGGVLPLGVTMVSSEVYKAFASPEAEKTLYHGHSYTGNPVCISAALASTKIFVRDNKVSGQIKKIEESHKLFAKTLAKNHRSKLNDVRVQGTIVALELKTSDGGYHFKGRDQLYSYFLEKGILLRPLGNVLYVMPPYCISTTSLRKIYKEIDSYLREKYSVQ